jgi:uncharacterized membrane protein YphA (DoxX/SURF4 family)
MAMTSNATTSVHQRALATTGSDWAFLALRVGFTVAPILAGADKFLNLMTDWTQYVAPTITSTLGISAHQFMMIVGAIEIVAGLLVAFKPRIGGMVVAAWLAGIILNFVLNPNHYWDVALRDLGLLIGAFSLSMLASDAPRREAV